MKLSAFITMTRPEERGDTFDQCYAAAQDFADEVVVIDGAETWPQEFDWSVIGEHFQRGYEACTGDWCVHLDADFIMHENDIERIRGALTEHNNWAAVTLYKYQFILPDRYNLKSRLVVAVNKGKFGDRLRFDSGGDLCQPSLDGKYINPDEVPESRIGFFNYEKLTKSEAQIKDDVGRMARAWQRHFGEYLLGGPDDENAYREWLKMVRGRFSKPQTPFPFEKHPKYIKDTIRSLTPDMWGYSGFGNLGVEKCYA